MSNMINEGNLNGKKIATDVVEVFCYISNGDIDMSIFRLTLDYKNYLNIAMDALSPQGDDKELLMDANHIVKTYYLSGKFKLMDFNEFLNFYLQGMNNTLEIFADFDRVEDNVRRGSRV